MKKIFTCILLIFSLLVPMYSGALSTTAYAEETTVEIPTKPTVTNVVAGVRVKWEAVDGAQKYGIWRSETGKNGNYEWLGNPGQNSYLDTEVESGKIYYYKVACVASGSGKDTKYGEKSEASGVVYVTTPDFTGRYNKAAGVTLEWQKIDGATGYAIYRKSFNGTDKWVRIGEVSNGSTLKWTDSSVKNNNGSVYRYAVRTLAGADSKTLSGCHANGRTMVRLTSRTLKNAEAVSEDSVKCSWTTTKEATGYEVRFMVGSEVFKTFTVGNYKTGVKTFAGLESGTEYKVQVRSYKKVDGVGGFYSAWSEPVYVITEGINPNPKEEPYEFWSGDYITTEDTILDLGDVVYEIDANVYVPGHLEAVTEAGMSALEKVSGLRFDGNGYCEANEMDENVYVKVSRSELFSEIMGYTGLASSEFGYAYVAIYDPGRVHLAPGELLLGHTYTLMHELSHVLMHRQAEWFHSTLLNEGFAEYTTYSMLLELEANEPEKAFYLGRAKQNLMNMEIEEEAYEELYKQPMEYWFENDFNYPRNGSGTYALGMRFMAYLEDVYGNYTDWIVEFGNMYPYKESIQEDNRSTVEQQLAVLKAVYGEKVFDDFYPWLKEHEADFDYGYQTDVDRRTVDRINIYPRYWSDTETIVLAATEYQDLYINLESARKYMDEYKNEGEYTLVLNTTNPYIGKTEPHTVNLYKADGSYIQVVTDQPISLDDISYIKLVGEGFVTNLEISGFSEVE